MTEFPAETGDPIEDAALADVPDQEEQLSQEQPADSLVDRGVDDVLDEGYSPPERYSSAERFGNTAQEMREGESFEERLRQEVPDEQVTYGDGPDSDPTRDPLEIPPEDDYIGDGEVGEQRAGRLVDPNEGIGPDEESELVGEDVGIDGAAAGAEEAAVHIIDEE
ncbi:MAG TPA: DUF5709 domain-containing protein [Nocardioidaceae bacterium]|jgi:hypothetical protein